MAIRVGGGPTTFVGDQPLKCKRLLHFIDEEDQAMLAEFWEFDRKMIHEKYKSVIEGLEKRQ
jgi:hypothetical protein